MIYWKKSNLQPPTLAEVYCHFLRWFKLTRMPCGGQLAQLIHSSRLPHSIFATLAAPTLRGFFFLLLFEHKRTLEELQVVSFQLQPESQKVTANLTEFYFTYFYKLFRDIRRKVRRFSDGTGSSDFTGARMRYSCTNTLQNIPSCTVVLASSEAPEIWGYGYGDTGYGISQKQPYGDTEDSAEQSI